MSIELKGALRMKESDLYLVRKCQQGDKGAFELLVIKYQRRIFNVILGVVRNRDIVEDLAQEAFLNAYRSVGGFKGNSSFYTWIYRIAVNVSINYLSKQKKAVFVDEGVMETEAVVSKSPTGFSPERSVQGSEFVADLSRAMESLPEDIRVAVTLREYEGLSYQEIADVTDSPVGTVRSRIFRGRAMLMEALKDHV
jgi:RNA polymerase sigma-70 factor (ECF subfamily)